LIVAAILYTYIYAASLIYQKYFHRNLHKNFYYQAIWMCKIAIIN